jgi:hypothetical protein
VYSLAVVPTQNESPQETTPEKTEGLHWSFYSLVATGLLLLYVLSVGPVARHYNGRRPPPPIDTFYAPIEFLAAHFHPAERFFEWYVTKVWLRLNYPMPPKPPPSPGTSTNTGSTGQ